MSCDCTDDRACEPCATRERARRDYLRAQWERRRARNRPAALDELLRWAESLGPEDSDGSKEVNANAGTVDSLGRDGRVHRVGHIDRARDTCDPWWAPALV